MNTQEHTHDCAMSGEVKEKSEDLNHFEYKLSQLILDAMTHRGFYDAGKYLNPTIIERIRPLLAEQRSIAQQEILDRVKDELKKCEILKQHFGASYREYISLPELEELLSTLKDTNI